VTELRARALRERFDPPVERCRFAASGASLLAELAAKSGWDDARIERVLWHGGLHLDGRPHHDVPERVAAGTVVDAYAFAWEPAPIAIGAAHVLAEGDDWLAATKPPWITTQRSRASDRLDLEAALRVLTASEALAAVHRLDRETSGVVLFAKTRAAAGELGRAFAEGRVAKRYRAIVSPPPRDDAFEVRGFLGRALDPARYRFALRDDAAPGFRASHSRFAVIERDGERAALACEPVTGRTHQLRVHLASVGAPIVGDALYGGVAYDRTLLHAEELRVHGNGAEIALRAPAPADLRWPGEDAT
jgi:23S rRNA pseudouridine1911/1915/1917 synthase